MLASLLVLLEVSSVTLQAGRHKQIKSYFASSIKWAVSFEKNHHPQFDYQKQQTAHPHHHHPHYHHHHQHHHHHHHHHHQHHIHQTPTGSPLLPSPPHRLDLHLLRALSSNSHGWQVTSTILVHMIDPDYLILE